MGIIRFFGDIHGSFGAYVKEAKDSPYPTIQIGDFGLGFRHDMDKRFIDMYDVMEGEHSFMRGNHDDIRVCKTSRRFIDDGSVIGNTMFVGGAWSIDHHYRTEGVNWWADEELSKSEFDLIEARYLEVKPDIMVTHDGPRQATCGMFINEYPTFYRDGYIPNRTSETLADMFDAHKPKIWIYGHWHHTSLKEIEGCLFVCVGEFEWVDIDTDKCEAVGRGQYSGRIY